MNSATELIEKLRNAAGDLASELALMHAAMFNLIVALRNTELSDAQSAIINATLKELKRSQDKFFATFGDEIGGANPQDN